MFMKSKWPVFNLVVTLLSIAGIYLINSGITSLKPVGQVANRNEFTNLTLPPGFIFSIWGVIYLGFMLFAFIQLSDKARYSSKFDHSKGLITQSIFLNLVWIILVGFEMFIIPYLLQWIMMALALLIVIRVMRNSHSFSSRWEKGAFVAFSLYAGWLTVAMIPYTTDILLATGWKGEPLTPEAWAIIVYVTACGIVFLTYRSLNNLWYVFPLIWALFGIAVKFSGFPAVVAGVLSGFGLVWLIVELIRRNGDAIKS
jgi:translocator protein